MKKHKIDFAVVFIVTVIFILIAVMFVWGVYNEGNRITSGVVVDKEFQSAYSYSSADANGNGQLWYYRNQRTNTYTLCIEGEKDGKTVRYWFEVPEEEFNQYHIGDYYSR